MRKDESRQFGEYTINVQQLPAMRAWKLSARLGKDIGPALAKVIDILGGKSLANVDGAALSSALTALFENLTENELEYITRTLLDSATVIVGGKNVALMSVFDVIMMGRVDDIAKIVWFAIEVNFGNFLSGFRALAEKVPATLATQSPA